MINKKISLNLLLAIGAFLTFSADLNCMELTGSDAPTDDLDLDLRWVNTELNKNRRHRSFINGRYSTIEDLMAGVPHKKMVLLERLDRDFGRLQRQAAELYFMKEDLSSAIWQRNRDLEIAKTRAVEKAAKAKEVSDRSDQILKQLKAKK